MFAFRKIFVGCERAAEERLDAEDGDEIVGYARALDALRARSIRQIEALTFVERDAVEQPGVLAPLDEIREVHADDIEVPARRRLVDVDEAIGVGKGERAQEQPVDQAKHDDVGGEAERQHADDERGRELLMRKRAEGVSEVGSEHEERPFGVSLRL